MPTSSTSVRPGSKSSTPGQSNKRNNYWPINNKKSKSYNKRVESETSSGSHKRSSKGAEANSGQTNKLTNKYNQQQQQHHHQIKHISSPSSLSSTSNGLKFNSINHMANTSQAPMTPQKESSSSGLNLVGVSSSQLVLTKPSGSSQALDSLNSLNSLDSGKHQISAPVQNANHHHHQHLHHHHTSGVKSSLSKSSSYQQQLVNSIQFPTSHSQNSLAQGNLASNSSSTAQLHSTYSTSNNPINNQTSFSIKRKVNLKYIKTIIILLLALDLMITVFVHQFSTQDYLNIWFTSIKLRFSLLNLILSAIWFVILIGAILYDVYFILLISSLVHISSFVLLFVFSLRHFMRKIDYNTVNLTSLLALLFSIILLHVYLIVLFSLTIYLMQAVRRRQKIPQ